MGMLTTSTLFEANKKNVKIHISYFISYKEERLWRSKFDGKIYAFRISEFENAFSLKYTRRNPGIKCDNDVFFIVLISAEIG